MRDGWLVCRGCRVRLYNYKEQFPCDECGTIYCKSCQSKHEVNGYGPQYNKSCSEVSESDRTPYLRQMDMIPQTEKKKTYVGRSDVSYTMQNLQVISWQHQLENLEKYGYKFTIGEIENAANRIEPSQGPPLFEINDSFYSIQDFKILSEMVKNFLENKRIK